MDSVTTDQQPNLQDQSSNNKNVENKSQQQQSSATKTTNGQEKNDFKKEPRTRRIRERVKKVKAEDPKTIIGNVLSKTDYREPNLSQFVEEKFYECPEYITEFKEQIKDIKYVSTVGEVIDGFSDVCISVLPDKFEGSVNANPSSISSLPCLYQKPQTNRWKEKRLRAKEIKAKNKKAKKKQLPQQEKKQDDSGSKRRTEVVKVAQQDKNIESK